jgi:iron complex transport system substrate-binding protein
VREAMASGKVDQLYKIDETLLRELRPDVVLSQGLCQVCSIDVQTVHRICKNMDPAPKIVDISPENLDEVLRSVLQVGEAVGMEDEV